VHTEIAWLGTGLLDWGAPVHRLGIAPDANGYRKPDGGARTNTERGDRNAHAQGHTHHDRNGSPVAQEAVEVTSADARRVLEQLLAARSTALATGLAHNVIYMDDLEAELEAARDAYVGLAVTEIATCTGSCSADRSAEPHLRSYVARPAHTVTLSGGKPTFVATSHAAWS
jgi:hypothetical protein